MGLKQHLGDISPAFGAATGEGKMGQMLNPDEAYKIAEKEQEAAEAAKKQGYYNQANSARGMKKGGKVSSASSRGDGCACRGKTKGRMV